MTLPRPALVASLAPSGPPDYPDMDRRTCQLMGPTALVVQALMGMGVIATLLYKRQREKPQRKWRVWLFDISKQILGQIAVHFSNIGISDWISHISVKNPCVTYFLNVLVDATIGVGLIYVLLWGSTRVLTDYFKLHGFKTGEYGDGPKPSLTYWGRQAMVYVACLLVMKLAVIALFVVWPYIFKIGEWLLSWTGNSNWVQVVVVMGLFPILLNMLQFWMIDSIVKASGSLGFTNALSPPVDESREPLFVNEEDSDGEDGPRRREHGHQTPVDLEGGYTLPTNHTATHAQARSPSSANGKLANTKSTAAELDESGKSRASIESQQPSVRRRTSPLSPPHHQQHHGVTAESLTGWGASDDPGWDGEQQGAELWGGAGAGKRRLPRRSLSIGRGGRVGGGESDSWKLDTISPSHHQITT